MGERKMFEAFIGRQIQKIHRLFVYDTETESTMLMEDSLIFVFDDGAVYQLHSQQAMVQLLNIVDNNFYTNWEIDDGEYLKIKDENILPFASHLQPVEIIEFWVKFADSEEIEGIKIVGFELNQLNILTCLGDYEVHLVEQSTFEEFLNKLAYPIERRVITN